ncbi:hypothetical protein BGZ94_009074 [Podila epigama]|nr:hypothetical protein BGZ94_009074 [Podila epigama]
MGLESKHSNSFEVVSIDDNDPPSAAPASPNPRNQRSKSCFTLSPRSRLVVLAGYLMASGLSSLYFCLVQAGLNRIEICPSVTGCLLYSVQGWPALGQQSMDLLVMSYISGFVSVMGGLLGTLGIYAAYKVHYAVSLDNVSYSTHTYALVLIQRIVVRVCFIYSTGVPVQS